MLSIIKSKYKDIVSDIYNTTNGNIIFCGSLALKLRNIIDREIDDFDFNISQKDWLKYKSLLDKKYKFYPGIRINYGWFAVDTYLGIANNDTMFHTFVDIVEQEYDEIYLENIKCKIQKPELICKHKEIILNENPELIKHNNDIDSIKLFLNEK